MAPMGCSSPDETESKLLLKFNHGKMADAMRDEFRPNLGGMSGAVVGAIGGLFALGAIPAIQSHDVRYVFNTPLLNLVCWIVSLPLGWLVGGFIGKPVGDHFRSQRAEVIAGAFGGLVPIVLIALLGWQLWRG